MTDDEYYSLCLAGDDRGLEGLMVRYEASLMLYIWGYLQDVHEAEDLMIETFAYLLAKRPGIRSGGVKAYLFKISRNMALRHKHRRGRCFSLEDLEKEPQSQLLVEEAVRTKERNRMLHLCMQQLNAQYREALYLVYFENLSYQEAAQVMKKSVKQITNLVYRGKQSLRLLLQEKGILDANP